MDETFDNGGGVLRAAMTVNGDTWTSKGSFTDGDGKQYQEKSTATFSTDGKSCTIKAELSKDNGKTWQIWWELTATRVRH